MATEHDQTPRKLVYLRDHAPRARGRAVRTERKPAPPAHPELAAEAAWLSRLLLAVAGGVVIYWLLLASGAFRLEGEAWNWTISQSLGHFFVALTSAWAARLLVRGATRAPLVVALAAGGLIVVALEGLVHLVVNGDLSQISLAVRTNILTRTTMLAIGIWASSYALRAERRPPPS